jgi:long-chain acyl-CoA synthetase
MDSPNETESRLVGRSFSHTREEIEHSALRTAGRLRRLGVRSGDRVLLKGGNTVELITTLLALMHLDTSVALLDNQLTRADCEHSARLTRARWLLSDEGDDLGEVTGIALLAATGTDDEPYGAAIDFTAWLARRDALITWSSGSTGAAKGIVRRGGALFDNLAATSARLGYRESDVLLPVLPFTHFYGLTIVLLWWLERCTLVITPVGRLDQVLRLSATHGATVVDATPSTYYSVLRIVERHPSLRPGVDGVRMWCVGGSPLSPTLADEFAEKVGLPLLDTYGSSEAGNIALTCLENTTGCGTPIDGVTVTVVDDAGTSVGPGQVGKILVRTTGLMEGYLNADGTVGPQDPVYATGDIGYLDDDGNLFVLGRSNAVHRFGHTLYPAAIEQRVQACGAPVKVVALDDERRGCELVFVVADPSQGKARQWHETINTLLPAYEQPNHVVVVDEFPLTSNGKPDLATLQQVATTQRGQA